MTEAFLYFGSYPDMIEQGCCLKFTKYETISQIGPVPFLQWEDYNRSAFVLWFTCA